MSFGPFGVKQNIYQGSGVISMIPRILANEGWKRVMIVADPGVEKAGLIKPFEKILKDKGVEYCIFNNIRPNPEAVTIDNEAVPMFKKFKGDVLLAIGGGSTMDTAKGVAIVGESGMSIMDVPMAPDILMAMIETKEKIIPPLAHKTYPMIAVPTTCGTGSETCKNAVISDKDENKLVPMHDSILPKYAVCDPDLLATLPPSVAATTGMDALVQAIEGYVSLGASDFSEIFALRAVELIGQAIRPYYANRANPKWANMMSLGCIYQGISWDHAGPAQNHGTNHPITTYLHIAHGDTCAILLPPFIEWNGLACKDKFHKVYNLMFPDKAVEKGFEVQMLVDETIKLNYDLNIMDRKTMADYGAELKTIDLILEDFFNLPSYPRTTTREDWKKIMIKVMNGEYMLK